MQENHQRSALLKPALSQVPLRSLMTYFSPQNHTGLGQPQEFSNKAPIEAHSMAGYKSLYGNLLNKITYPTESSDHKRNATTSSRTKHQRRSTKMDVNARYAPKRNQRPWPPIRWGLGERTAQTLPQRVWHSPWLALSCMRNRYWFVTMNQALTTLFLQRVGP